MGIDITSLDAILLSKEHISNVKKNSLTIGRQQFHIPNYIINNFLKKYDLLNFTNKYNYYDYAENFLTDIFGYENVDSIDYSSYENAKIIHNMNNPFNYTKKYQFIYDGGTTEHIFNIPQVYENIINLLDVGGIFCSVTCNNNFSGHGFYQFSPEFFLSIFSKKYGMQLIKLYLAKVNTESKDWLDVNNYNYESFGRNCTSFNSTDPVYIIAIAKKISDNRENLINNSPQQNSYENIEWKQ